MKHLFRCLALLAAMAFSTPLPAQIVLRMGSPGSIKGPITANWDRVTTDTVTFPLPHAVTFWTNRHMAPLKTPNIIFPHKINPVLRTQYTTVLKADCATMSEVAYTMGAPDWRKWIVGWTDAAGLHPSCGLKVAPWASVQPDGVAATGGDPVVTDTFVIPPVNTIATAKTHVTILSLDYEPHDTRPAGVPLPGKQPAMGTAAWLLFHFSEFAHQHGYKAFLYTNPFSGPLQASQGLTAAATPALIANFDYVTNMVYSAQPGWTVQTQLAYGDTIIPASHEIITPFLDISAADMCWLHAQWLKRRSPGFMVFDNLLDANLPANVAKINKLVTGAGC